MKEIDERYFDKKENPATVRRMEDLITSDERILWKGKPKKGSYALEESLKKMPIGLLWGAIDVAILITVFTNIKDSTIFFFIIPFFALHLFPFWMWLYCLIKAARSLDNAEYCITNKRIISKKGKLGYINASIPVNEIVDVDIKRSAVDRLVRAGDIYIKGKTGAIAMFNIPNSTFIHEKLRLLAEDSDKNSNVFYKDNHICEHCGSYYSAVMNKCPNCGAPRTRK